MASTSEQLGLTAGGNACGVESKINLSEGAKHINVQDGLLPSKPYKKLGLKIFGKRAIILSTGGMNMNRAEQELLDYIFEKERKRTLDLHDKLESLKVDAKKVREHACKCHESKLELEYIRAADVIVDAFNFDRVRKVMQCLDWQWAGVGIPEIKDLRKEARRQLVEAARLYDTHEYGEESVYVMSGGLKATASRNDGRLWLQLEFVVETENLDDHDDGC